MALRRASKIDANQPEIVKALRLLGYSVLHVHQLKNCFDILVGAKGKNYAFELKDGTLPPSKKKLTPGEQEFFNKWQGQVNVAESLEDILKIIG
jgi:hypothetical protein